MYAGRKGTIAGRYGFKHRPPKLDDKSLRERAKEGEDLGDEMRGEEKRARRSETGGRTFREREGRVCGLLVAVGRMRTLHTLYTRVCWPALGKCSEERIENGLE